MSDYAHVECPNCGAEVGLEFYRTYQGQRPHGGYVHRVEVTDVNCECDWSDSDWEQMQDEAAERNDPHSRNFSPEELHRNRI